MFTLLLAGALLGSLSVYQGVTHRYDRQFGGLAMRQTMYDDKRVQDAHAGVEKDFYRSDRAEGPMLENNYYAQAMVVLLPLVMFLMRAEPRRSRRMAAAILGLIILLGGVLLTYSRGGVLVLGVLAVAVAWLRWVRPRYMILMGVACVVGTIALLPGLIERMQAVASVTQLRTGGQDADADVSVRGRATEMLAAALALRDHPLLGVGPGQYVPFYSLRYQRDPSIKFKDLQVPRPAHDLYVGLAAETGLVGLALFVAMPVWLVRQLWRERRRLAHVPVLADLAAALVLAIIAYHGAGLFLSFAYERYYWFLLALAGSTVAMLRAIPSPRHPERVWP
jgi:O-antigen ligase